MSVGVPSGSPPVLVPSGHPTPLGAVGSGAGSTPRLAGHLNPSVVPQVYSNRSGVIPKGANGKWRLIVDMSFLPGSSVNDGINEARYSLSYVQVLEASKGVMVRGWGTLMAKVDVKSAYRNIPVQTEDR